MTQEGVYDDSHDKMDPVVLEEYFNTRNPHDAQRDVHRQARRIEEDQQANIQHEAVDVPAHEPPFRQADVLAAFCTALDTVHENGILPIGFGIRVEEWDDGYPTSEVIQFGRRGTREKVISLPPEIWRPRAERWCQGLSVMLCILDVL